MNFEATYLKNIISANNSGSLAIFIGAGISKSSETSSFKLPNWNDLIVSLKRELNDIEENDYLKVAQLYYLAFGEYTYYKKLKEFFPENITPSKVHEIIFDINPHIVLTTNWDNILERTIEENAHVYDVICSDSDLVKSSLPNKLIKMHGDFKNHNIVFKEDDYINYQFNFPLIENYVKSVLSTHTILFIGYSYNDTNLKQILNWIKNHSNVRPPMYLATFEENQTQLKYLENHGISSIILKDYDNDSIHGDEYSKKMYCFLNKIINQDAQRLLSSNDQVINFVLDKIEPLNDLNGILLDQIQESLSNCGFIYDDDSYPILEFYDQVLTTDLDTNIRGIYKRFIEVLKTIDEGSTPNPNMMKIFNILSKARVKGIVISSDDLNKNSKEYLSIEPYVDVKSIKENEKYYDFDFSDTNKKNIDLMGLFEQAFSYYNLNQFEDAFYTMEEIVSSCLKERNYTLLFIAMFNRNVLLRRIKYSYSDSRDKFKEVKEYNLKERYYKLPKILRLATYPIYEFVDFSLIYKYAYTVSEHLNQTEQSKKTIESGGLVFNSNIKQFSSKHENIVNFILSNKIMLENYKEYRIINKHFVEISILRQIQKDHTCLSKTELYSSIKLFDYKEIKDVFSDFYNNKSNENKKFAITSQDKEWLIKTVFPNIVDVFIKHNGSLGGNENHLKNLLFILSLVELSESEVAEIFDIIKTIILQGNNSIDIFQSVNLFLGIQYNLYNMVVKEDTIVEIIEGLINKIIYKKYNWYFYHAITGNRLSNLYGYAQESKVILNNVKLISRLIDEIDSYDIRDKINILQEFVLKIYDISSEDIKEKIKSFSIGIDTSKEKDIYTKIIFDLTLVIYGFKEINDQNISEVEAYLEQYKDGSTFSTALYLLDSYIDHLIKNKNLESEFEISSKLIKNSIDLYEKRDRLSII